MLDLHCQLELESCRRRSCEESTEVGRPARTVGSVILWAWGKGGSKGKTFVPTALFIGLIQRIPALCSLLSCSFFVSWSYTENPLLTLAPPSRESLPHTCSSLQRVGHTFLTIMDSCLLKPQVQISHFFLSCFCQVFGYSKEKRQANKMG